MNLGRAGLIFAALCCLWSAPDLARAASASDPYAALRVERNRRPTPVGDRTLKATDGTSIRLADYKGKVVVIHFLLTN
jgi:cytochrome oxidase Cu insertion factor (SCO1/SenC/PrrC family)